MPGNKERGPDGQPACLQLFKAYVIGEHIDAHADMVLFVMATPWMLLNFLRAMNSKWAQQIQGDVTGKASNAALNKMVIGVNSLGNHCNPLAYALIPDHTESQNSYEEVWKATAAAIRALMTRDVCDKVDCECCRCISELREQGEVRAYMSSPAFRVEKKLPVDFALGDNSYAWQNCVANVMGITSGLCQTHLSAIAANNGQHRKHFSCPAAYESFYELVCRLMPCAYDVQPTYVGTGLQRKLVVLLHSRGEVAAAIWFEQYWTGPVKGRWLCAHFGIGLTCYQNSLESQWRWDRRSICNNQQVRTCSALTSCDVL